MDDYVAELRAAGPASFRAAHDHAVLVRRDSTDDDDAPEFHTGFMNREEMAARLAELDKAGGPSRVGSVHEVTKRKGGIFADRYSNKKSSLRSGAVISWSCNFRGDINVGCAFALEFGFGRR